MKLATESAWTALLSRRFHSVVVLGKESFCTGQCGRVGYISMMYHWDTHSWGGTKMKLVTQQQENYQYLGPARRLIRLFKSTKQTNSLPPSLPAPLMQTMTPSCDNETSNKFEHKTVLSCLSEQRRRLHYRKGRTETEDLEWEEAGWPGVNGKIQNVELDDFNTSQQKNNGRMPVAVCDIRSAMFKCQFSKLFKQI